MKKMVFTMLLGVLTITAFSQSLDFENLEYKEVLSRAKALNKPVLFVAYNENNMPLQFLINKTLYPEAISKTLNSQFIVNMLYSKSEDGKPFLEKNNVFDFPAVIVLKPNGEMVAKHVNLQNASDPSGFFKVVNQVLEDPVSLKKYEKNYSKNQKQSAFLRGYVCAKLAYQEAHHEILDTYLKSLSETELNTDHVLQLLVQDADFLREKTFACDFLLKKRSSNDVENRSTVETLLNKLALNTIASGARFNDPKKINEAISIYGIDPITPQIFVPDFLNMEYFRQMNSIKEFKVYALKYMDQCLLKHQPANAKERSLMVQRILVTSEYCMRHISDPELLNKSLDWTKYATELDSSDDMAHLLYANLLYKTGKKEEAKAEIGLMIQNANLQKSNLVNYFREVHKKMYANQQPW